jgi:hypothetical protein
MVEWEVRSVWCVLYYGIYLWLYSPLLNFDRFFSFFIFLRQGISPSQGRYLHTGEHKQIFMPRVGFEPMIPVFELAKTFQVLRPRSHYKGLLAHTIPIFALKDSGNTREATGKIAGSRSKFESRSSILRIGHFTCDYNGHFLLCRVCK